MDREPGKGFSGLVPGGPLHDLVRVDPCYWMHKHMTRQRLAAIKLLGRSCRRWQLTLFAAGFTRELRLGMHLGFCYPRRNQVAPGMKHDD